MNISKLHHKIDELEVMRQNSTCLRNVICRYNEYFQDDIIREKTKVNAVSMQLDDTFTEMLTKY